MPTCNKMLLHRQGGRAASIGGESINSLSFLSLLFLKSTVLCRTNSDEILHATPGSHYLSIGHQKIDMAPNGLLKVLSVKSYQKVCQVGGPFGSIILFKIMIL